MYKTPEFWRRPSFISHLLKPLSWVYTQACIINESRQQTVKMPIPIICVGNLVMGGAGKTPTVVEIVRILKEMGETPHIISRGYGGYFKHLARVSHETHSYLQVGDEPLLLANIAPTWVGSNRVKVARAAVKEGATVLVMDDGIQNPTLHKDLSLIVIDSLQGLGNLCVFPAGPLREPIKNGLKRAQGIILIGGSNPHPKFIKNYMCAKIVCDNTDTPGRVIAFAGIGYPDKFRSSLESSGYDIIEFVEFADHHPYTIREIQRLIKIATHANAQLITTEKDLLRVPPEYRKKINILKIHLEFEDENPIRALLQKVLLKTEEPTPQTKTKKTSAPASPKVQGPKSSKD